jgi:hypothetical protein
MMKKPTESRDLRSFGLLVGGVFAVIALWPVIIRGETIRLWALVIAGSLGVPAVVYPKSLRLVHQVWIMAGHALGWINTRLILGFIYYFLFTPMGLVMRMMGKDPMCRRIHAGVESYRVIKQQRSASHLLRQF